MFLTIFDLVLLLVLFTFISFSFWLGLIQTFGGLVGLFLGIFISGRFYEGFANWLEPYVLDQENVARVIAFIVIFVIVNRLVGLIFHILNKVFNIISLIPFLKSINRIGGAILGFIEGILVCGAILLVLSKFPINDWIINIISGSKVAMWLLKIADFILSPLLPKIIFEIQDKI